jgi:hypothetical protein
MLLRACTEGKFPLIERWNHEERVTANTLINVMKNTGELPASKGGRWTFADSMYSSFLVDCHHHTLSKKVGVNPYLRIDDAD